MSDSLPAALLIDDRTAATLAGVSRATWLRQLAAGGIPAPVRIGRRRLWRRAELVAWVEAGCPDRRTWEAMRDMQARRAPRVVG